MLRVYAGSEISASTGTVTTTVDRLERCAGNSAPTHLSTHYLLAVYSVPRVQGWGTW